MTTPSKHYFFLGIGGIGMSALARYFRVKGFKVAGYDKTSTELTETLESEGIEVIYDDEIKAVPNIFLDKNNCQVIYTPAIPKNSVLLHYFKDNGFSIVKRAEKLGEISKNQLTIAVAGTHGKTTISIMIAHLLRNSGIKINALLGGISHNFNSNVVLEEDAEILITEADEYDQSFLSLHPDIAVISSVDADHLDIYGQEDKMLESYSTFAQQISEKGILISPPSVIEKLDVSRINISYGLEIPADYSATNIRVKDGEHYFDIQSNEETITDFTCGLPGIHNIENSVAAIAVAVQIGCKWEDIRSALKNFKGIKRRFDVHIKTNRLIYIDDYAHHPKEIDALLKSVKALYPHKKMTGIFQPHLFSRTRDFADEFAKSLSQLDELLLLDIYPAREEPIEGITSEWLLEKVETTNKKSCKLEEALSHLDESDLEVLLTIGAGNIDKLVKPLKAKLETC